MSLSAPNGVDRPREIVGVVADIRGTGPREAPEPTIFVPNTQHPTDYGGASPNRHNMKQLVIKTTGDASFREDDLRRTIAEVDPRVAAFYVMTMQGFRDEYVTEERFWMRALGIFAVLGLILAVIGIYGVVSYAVAQRTREIGVRKALGAQRTDVLGMVIREGMITTLGGVIVGVLGALAATRLLSAWLYGVEATDPATFVTVSVTLVGIALLASYVPARTAARVDPVIAMRSD